MAVSKKTENAEVIYEDRVDTSGIDTDGKHVGYYEFHRLVKGSCLYMIGNRSYEADAGDILVIPDGVNHRIIEGDPGRTGVSVRCLSHYIPEPIKETLRSEGPIFRSEGTLLKVDEILERIKDECEGGLAYSLDMKKCLIKEMSVILARCRNTYHAREERSPAIATALVYIRDHSNEKISLTEVAAAAGVSVAYLSRKFKSDIGIGFSEYVSAERLAKAEAMLRENRDMSITEVAFSTGFNDSNYFSDKFKRTYGVSPLQYRKRG